MMAFWNFFGSTGIDFPVDAPIQVDSDDLGTDDVGFLTAVLDEVAENPGMITRELAGRPALQLAIEAAVAELAKVELEKGKEYLFCACGRSQSQPFCDGSHKGTSFKPKAFTAEKDGDAWLCACKHSRNKPFCDGSHKDTGIEPLRFTVDYTGTFNICGCKTTDDEPYCDGSHLML